MQRGQYTSGNRKIVRTHRLARAVCEAIEQRIMLTAPYVLPPTSAPGRDGHFVMNDPQRLEFDFSQTVTPIWGALWDHNLTDGSAESHPETAPGDHLAFPFSPAVR